MSIDEAIEWDKRDCEEWNDKARIYKYDTEYSKKCKKWADVHKKYAEWLTQLKEYQQLEANGRLVKLPCKDVYFIVYKNNPKYALVMRKSIRDLAIYEIENIDKEGCKYFSTKEEAEAKLAELIRAMSDEELAELFCKVKSDYQWLEHAFPSEEEYGEWVEWLQSEAE